MRALTIRQPWADAIANTAIGKHTENRSWRIPQTLRGTKLLIHAAAADDPRVRNPRPGSALDGTSTTIRSAIVAAATLASDHWADVEAGACCCAPWGRPGLYHWRLTDVVRLPEPVPAKGRLGLWRPDEALLAAVQQQLTEVTR